MNADDVTMLCPLKYFNFINLVLRVEQTLDCNEFTLGRPISFTNDTLGTLADNVTQSELRDFNGRKRSLPYRHIHKLR
jgi:hypothetical protein